jgi:hypothetical protein
VGHRLTLRRGSVWPMVGFIVGTAVVLLVVVALYPDIRSYLEPSKAPASRRLELALAGNAAGLASSAAVIPAAKAASAPPAPAARPEPMAGVWAMALPPTWLTTVDAAAGLGVPTAVEASVPIADTLPRPSVVGLAAVSALVIAPQHFDTSALPRAVPLPRPRPPKSKHRR